MVACDTTTAGLPPQCGQGLAQGPHWGPYRVLCAKPKGHAWLALDPSGHWLRLHLARASQAQAWRRWYRLMSRLVHPNLGHVRDLIERPGSLPVLVESQRQEACLLPGLMTDSLVAHVVAQLAQGLAALHQLGWAYGAVGLGQVRVGPQWEAGWVPSACLTRVVKGDEIGRDLRALGKLLLALASGEALRVLGRRLMGPNPIGAAECAAALMGEPGLPPLLQLPLGSFQSPPAWKDWLALELKAGCWAWQGGRGLGLSRLVVEHFHQLRRAQVVAIALCPRRLAAEGDLVAQLAAWLAAWGDGPMPQKAQAALRPEGQDLEEVREGLLLLLARMDGPVAVLVAHWDLADAWSQQVLRWGEWSLGHAHVVLTGESIPAGVPHWPLLPWAHGALAAWVEEVNGGPLFPGQAEALARGAAGLPGRMAQALLELRASGQRLSSRRAWLALAAAARRRARAGEPLKALAAAEGAMVALLAIDAPQVELRRAGTLAADLARRAGHGQRAAKAYRWLLRHAELGLVQSADLSISLARAEWLSGRNQVARRVLEAALARLNGIEARATKEAQARVHLALSRMLPHWDPAAACRHAELAVGLSKMPFRRAIARVHLAHARTHLEGAVALPALEAAVLPCLHSSDPELEHTARMLWGDGLMHTGRLLEAQPCFAANLARGQATGDPSEVAYATINLALLAECTHDPELLSLAMAGAQAGAGIGDVLLEELGSELVATAQRRRGPAFPSSSPMVWRSPMAIAYAQLASAEAHLSVGLAKAAWDLALPLLEDVGCAWALWRTRARLVVLEALLMQDRTTEATVFMAQWLLPEAPSEAAHHAFATALLAQAEGAIPNWSEVHQKAQQAGLNGLALRVRLRELAEALRLGDKFTAWEGVLALSLLHAEQLKDPSFIAPLAAALAAAKVGPESAKLSDLAAEMALQAWALDMMARDHPERRALLEAEGQARRADLARRLMQSEGKVASSDRVRQALAAQLESSGHDLRGPLSSIRAGIQALRQGLFGAINPEQAEAMTELFSAAIVLERRVDGMLDAARLEAGALRVQRMRLDWRRLLKEPLDLLMPFAKQRGVHLSVPCACSLDALPSAFGDGRRLAGAVQNLLHNALKFTPQGASVALEVAFDHAWVYLQVLDEGPGLPEERRSKPFARFGHSQGGNGLGLWLAHEVVRLHGGQLTARPRERIGTCFSLQLPQACRPAH